MGQDRQERSVWTGRPDKSAWIGQPGQDSLYRIEGIGARTGQPKRTVGIIQPGQEREDTPTRTW